MEILIKILIAEDEMIIAAKISMLLLATEVADKVEATNFRMSIGDFYIELRNFPDANKDLNSRISMGTYYRGMELLDSLTGNWKGAYLNHKQYAIIRDSLFNKETIKKLVPSRIKTITTITINTNATL